ncbi:TIGR00282 family metallophosphoesterase [Acetobacterium bakii]|uniref:Metallophosphoesterase n=1 Tax=Acetobacterium bakii TaxID=52689 RepID=A0A0L6TZG7_9FIRM|nr:TIGR00282 family metallophosphoesterase [Acetobacterium bakii]KNZ41666.1 metallophosphoesterase [Acetobacterium bakii]
MKILILGDVFGRPGRNILRDQLSDIISEHDIDFTIINGENASGGNGLTIKNARELLSLPIDAITMGNHVWHQKEMLDAIDDFPQIIRPLNYPDPCPGKGYKIFLHQNKKICIINLSGQIFMPNLSCPFSSIQALMDDIKDTADLFIIDFHAEATSEKIAFGYYMDGIATAVYGTHTHVQTADERLLPQGTAYITDIGMTGPLDGVIGVDKEIVLETMITKRPKRFVTATGKVQINGIILEISDVDGKATAITRFYETYEV